ncbi:MAG: hypothetical protein ACKVY0_15655 [Prosthecobacter sp.]|uniref:hypothetical protein n=1 Tax=Prosthecobacter sp. TaxID=1965333 RepID=UPI0039030F82
MTPSSLSLRQSGTLASVSAIAAMLRTQIEAADKAAGGKVFGQMLNAPGKSIPPCTHSFAEVKAFYRWLDVDPGSLGGES